MTLLPEELKSQRVLTGAFAKGGAVVSLAILIAGCGAGGNPAPVSTLPSQVTVTVTQTATSAPPTPSNTPTPSTTSPATPVQSPTSGDDPLARIKIDPNSAWSPDQQRYLAALRQALNKRLVNENEAKLILAGTAACAGLDRNPRDVARMRSLLTTMDEFMADTSIPGEYVLLGAAAALCPAHKQFVLGQLGGLVG